MGAIESSHARKKRSRYVRMTIGGLAAALVTSVAGFGAAKDGSAASIGGVNTGQPGSTCAPSDGGLSYTAPGAGISTTALGQAPAYYELGAPAGAFVSQPPKGLMIVIHGGGWYVVGPAAVAAARPAADIWRNRGWETLSIDYTACAKSFNDVLWFHDTARAAVGRSEVMCALGQSAGGQLALMLANRRPDVACVVAEGAPTNLVGISTENAFDPTTGVSDQSAGSSWVQNLAIAAFGSNQLQAMSPVSSPGASRLLLATAVQDEFIPWAQATDMANAVKSAHPGTYTDLDQLAAGTYYQFTHTDFTGGTGVSQTAYDDYLVRQLKLVTPLLAPRSASDSVTNDIRVSSAGNYSVGDEEFDTTALVGKTSATVNGRVALGPGNTFQVTSCIAYYDPVRAPAGWCASSTIDTHGNTGAVGYKAPSVSAQWQDPSPGSGQGFAYGAVYVSYMNNGSWARIASSIPDSPTDAGVWVP